MSEDVDPLTSPPEKERRSMIALWSRLKHQFTQDIEAQRIALAETESYASRISQCEDQIKSLRHERSLLTDLLGRQQTTLTQFTDLQREKEQLSIRVSELESELQSKDEELSVIAVERAFDVQSLEKKRTQELGKVKLSHEADIRELKNQMGKRILALRSEFETKENASANHWKSLIESKDKEIQRITESYETKFAVLEDELMALKDSNREESDSSYCQKVNSDIEKYYKKRLTDMRTYYENKLLLLHQQSPSESKTCSKANKKKISFVLPGEEGSLKDKFTFKKIPEPTPELRSVLKETPKKRKLFNISQNLLD